MYHEPSIQDFDEIISQGPIPIRFPRKSDLDQDEEWCEIKMDGEWRKIRFHDYDEIYKIPGLYETIFYRTLRCNSPWKVADLLRDVILEEKINPEEMRVFDLGAGNGMMGEALQNLGIRSITGCDILDAAKAATIRDRSWAYNEYFAMDLTNCDESIMTHLKEQRFNLVTTVAALGFGDIPPAVFSVAYNLLDVGGLVAFNIKEDFLSKEDQGGFSGLINNLTKSGQLRIEYYRRYCHRFSINGDPLFYIGIVAQKTTDADI
ncbi:class I SAM-dependent DNA methyltransferase [Pseudobacteriovorax antillogorgiicola]|uniref:Methyltransferase domain-containing protein n=1 Tax=Pseudobacteriovorax antillogorgiicola TaxID=1513793 RepID=A0A1Y6BEP9_9BACT|nr:methyltransferase domain-containing protein [Pseudobacteriovorax antillogorgiicola]TCS57458.1 methyltransferase family protein [Pseudobacteriovorax antillogorgiicola]SMF00814.1 Methyltransferase domain-containing protein [Pseudobacteriovorax antillogorgiicola]